METYNEMLRRITEDYLSDLDMNNLPPSQTIEEELLENTRTAIMAHNDSVSDKTLKWRMLHTLTFSQIADVMCHCYSICRVSTGNANSDPDYDVLAIYQTDGPNQGIYVTSEDDFRCIARTYNYSMSSRDFGEIMIALRDKTVRRTRCMDKNLIAVNNGIFDYETKTLLPFTPERVFLTKSHVNYNPNATNVIIHNNEDGTDWDVESWMESLSDDHEIVQLLWEILGAIIRPNVRWNKSAWLYSEQGNNGKGTLCELMRNLCGEGSYASIPLSAFGTDFMLEPLTRASAIIVDENDVGTYVDKAANLKAIITNDVISINRKFKMPIAYQFFGFMVQCLNEFPRIKDKSDSFYRRQLFIPMTKCFTGKERKYIKSDYLHRTEVLEYVLHRVLHMDYDTLSEPEACRKVLAEYKEFNDPTRLFFEEIVEQECVWDLLPFRFLYPLYRAWMVANVPNGKALGRNVFINEIVILANKSTTWTCPDKSKNIRTSNLMDHPEPLIARYGMDEWKNPTYRGNDLDRICSPITDPQYRGLVRLSAVGVAPQISATAEEEE